MCLFFIWVCVSAQSWVLWPGSWQLNPPANVVNLALIHDCGHTQKSWQACPDGDSNRDHNVNSCESFLYQILQGANLHDSCVPFLLDPLISSQENQLFRKRRLFYCCKKEKHKKREINVLTSEMNKCSSCLHCIEVFDIPNYDITVGVVVAAVAFVKWSAISHANKKDNMSKSFYTVPED